MTHGHGNSECPYRPLSHDQIRILVLQPSRDEDEPLEVSLRTVSLGELPGHPYIASDLAEEDGTSASGTHFEAISYCWGEPVFSQHCFLTEGGKVALTESLHSALRAFRRTDKERNLWADAICINQADLEERSSQVELMGEIFTKASRVIVWLGSPLSTGSDTLAFAMLNMPIIAQGDRSRKDLLSLLEQHIPGMECCACCKEHITHGTPVTLASGLSAIAKLLERPFFNRLWVVQEIVFAQAVEVYCGTHHAPWQIFTELSRVPGQYHGDQEYDDYRYSTAISRSALRQAWAQCNYLNQLRSRHRHQKTDVFRPTELCKDLLMLSNLRCRNPHDRIFGVSRVLGLRGIAGLRADYHLSVAEVYRRVAETFVTAQANRPGGHAALLLALASTETSEAKLLDKPSWVPDFQYLTERSRAKNTYYQWAFAQRQYYADAAMFRCFITDEKPLELCVRGRHCGIVTAILEDSQCPSKHVHRRTGAKCPSAEGVELIRWHDRCCDFLERSAFLDWVTADEAAKRIDDVFSCDVAKDGASLYEETILEWLSTMPDPEDLSDVHSLYRQLKPYITGYPLDRDRLLCTVHCGSGVVAGWVPSGARPGDCICQFVGAPYPFLLRPQDDSTFHVLGDVFLAGISEPEALGIDHVEWQSRLENIKECGASLKAWMQSDDRKELKTKDDRSGRVWKDERMKSARQDSVDRLKSLYSNADHNLEWICLR